MKIYHYTTADSAKKILRVLKRGYLEFYLGSQEQSGHSTGSYWSKKSPDDIAAQNQPVSRFFGTEAMPTKCVVFELEVDKEWEVQKRVPDSLPAFLKPIPGARGTTGIALCMNKGKSYAEPLDPDDDSRIAKNDCILLSATELTGMYIMNSGAKPEVEKRMAVAPNNLTKLDSFIAWANT